MSYSSRKLRILTSIVAVVFLSFICCAVDEGQAASIDRCKGPYKGKKLSEDELKRVIRDHSEWLKVHRDELWEDLGLLYKRKTNLCEANLSRADLRGADLTGVDLSGADLSRADLTEAKLTKADLYQADLGWADLSRANLSEADLMETKFFSANLTEAYLSGPADPTEAELDAAYWGSYRVTRANLTGPANLDGADLSLANLTRANLARTNLNGANLSLANLNGADLTRATLSKASLNAAKLIRAKLIRAKLYQADLSWADLSRADLSGAYLTDTDLTRANLTGANLTRVDLEWYDSSLRKDATYALLGAKGLSDIKIERNLTTIVEVRKMLKEVGFRNEEKSLTSALRKHQLKQSGWLDYLFTGYLRGGMLTDFGASPYNALIALLILTFLGFGLYALALGKCRKKAGIWRIRPENRLIKDVGESERELLRWKRLGLWRSLFIALYFSLISTFYFGWRELNISNWMVRIQKKEYILQASGWVRTVSGIQSLISLYLVALFLLTFFGSPFE